MSERVVFDEVARQKARVDALFVSVEARVRSLLPSISGASDIQFRQRDLLRARSGETREERKLRRRSSPKTCVTVVWAMALLLPTKASRADGLDEARPPMPEPIAEETTTDIDGRDPGELEFEVNAVMLRSRIGGAFNLQFSAEIEWQMIRRFGVKLEPFYELGADAGASTTKDGGVSLGTSFKLVQDFKHDFHLQAEASGHVPTGLSTTLDPGESPLPLSFDLRSGLRRGAWTLRNSLGVSAGRVGAHVPIHGSAALLTGFEPTGTCGFWGIEVEADGARPRPVVVALDLVPSLLPAGLPFSIGFVLLSSVAADANVPSYGFMVRLFVESEREREYGARSDP